MGTPSEDLQKAVRAALLADAEVAAVVGTRVRDGLPLETDAAQITFGPSDYTLEDMDCIDARVETIQLDCWVRDSSGALHPARALADKVKVAVHGVDLALDTHALANLRVVGVRAMMDPDGLTGHGIVTVEALVEER